MKSAVLFITWHCQNFCPYCWQRQAQKFGEFTPEPLLPAEKWIEAINRMKIETLDISGGEPFMQPDFIKLIESIKVTRVAFTSNLRHDITELVQKVSPEKLFSITASYHPTSDMSLEEFSGKILLLKAKGFSVTINYVAYPEQMYLIGASQAYFNKLGFRFHVDPYAQTKFFPYEFSKEELDFLKIYVKEDRQNFFDKPKDDYRFCSGGRTHLNIQPNGDAYRCISDKVDRLPMVGNIFDPEFKPYNEDKVCNKYWRCSGCDKDKVEIKEPRIAT